MIKVIADTREKLPWSFDNSEQIEVVTAKLDTGDYSILGLENKLCIERKRSVSELAGNITQSRFERELERMSAIPHSFILLEFGYDVIEGFPHNAHIPLKQLAMVKVSSAFIMRRLSEIQIKHGVHVVPCGNSAYAEYVATNLIKRVNEFYSN